MSTASCKSDFPLASESFFPIFGRDLDTFMVSKEIEFGAQYTLYNSIGLLIRRLGGLQEMRQREFPATGGNWVFGSASSQDNT